MLEVFEYNRNRLELVESLGLLYKQTYTNKLFKLAQKISDPQLFESKVTDNSYLDSRNVEFGDPKNEDSYNDNLYNEDSDNEDLENGAPAPY